MNFQSLKGSNSAFYKNRPTNTCKHCGYSWQQQKSQASAKCPKCQCKNWMFEPEKNNLNSKLRNR